MESSETVEAQTKLRTLQKHPLARVQFQKTRPLVQQNSSLSLTDKILPATDQPYYPHRENMVQFENIDQNLTS